MPKTFNEARQEVSEKARKISLDTLLNLRSEYSNVPDWDLLLYALALQIERSTGIGD